MLGIVPLRSFGEGLAMAPSGWAVDTVVKE
jgi:hypothetical protein